MDPGAVIFYLIISHTIVYYIGYNKGWKTLVSKLDRRSKKIYERIKSKSNKK